MSYPKTNRKRTAVVWLLALLFTSLLLSACSPGSSDTDCLVGIWELNGEEAYAIALLPPGAIEPETLTYEGTQGGLALKFDENGQLTVLSDEWLSRLNVRIDDQIYILELVLNGFVIAEYSVDGDTLTVGEPTGGQISYLAVMDGEMMIESFQAQEFLPLFVEPYKNVRFECSEGTLTLEIQDLPEEYQAITFKRVQEGE